jgi:hypothetical protein
MSKRKTAKRRNSDPHNITQKTDDWAIRAPIKTFPIRFDPVVFVCVFIWIWPVFMIVTLYKHLCFAFRKSLFNSTAHYIICVMSSYYIVMSLFRITYTMHFFEFNLRELTTKWTARHSVLYMSFFMSPYCWRICEDDESISKLILLKANIVCKGNPRE